MEPLGKYASLGEITLLPGNAFAENRDRAVRYLKKLDPERMLYNFRRAFGIPTDAQPLGGWEEPDGLLRGHSTGHYLSALSLAYSATGDRELLENLNTTVHGLRELQKLSHGDAKDFVTACTPEDCPQEKWSRDPSCWGEGYLSAYPPDQFALLEQFARYAKIWAPYYTLHKITAGLIEAYERTGNGEALETACGIGDWIWNRLSRLSAEHRRKMWSLYIAGEYGGMNESLARLYRITGERKYLDCAKLFDNENLFPALAEGEDPIRGLHANQHIPQMLGAMLEYEASGDGAYRRIARNFFDLVDRHYRYVTGGVGQGECFREPDSQARFIVGDTNCETCATYNLLKLARELYAFEPENAGYMDYYERGLLNHILASQSPEENEFRTSGVTYMLPVGPGAEKEYSDDWYSFTCCHGTGMENHVKYPDAQFFLAGDTVYLNQYLPAKLETEGLTVFCGVSFPEGRGEILVSADHDITFKLRVPLWCRENPFTADGITLRGRYAVLEVKACTTAVIRVDFPYELAFEYTPDIREETGRKLAAALYGPFVMAACEGSKEFLPLESRAEPEIAADGFSMTLDGREFVPLYRVHGRPYHVYFDVR